MPSSDDKLKNLLRNNIHTPKAQKTPPHVPTPSHVEVNVGEYISPVAKIKVVGIGGGGGNTINHMIESWVQWVEFIAINADAQALFTSKAPIRINIWRATTRGLGAGWNPDIGKKAAEESSEEIKQALTGADMIFITTGLWGGTGTGAAPIIAEIAKSLGTLVVWVVTKPFSFEWQRRATQALEWFERLKEKVDTLITIPNDKILTIIDKKTPLLEAFHVADEILKQGVEWVSDLITFPGVINLDFADLKSIMENAGSALIGIGYGSGENRASEAARNAIESPLLELSIMGAKGLLFNITGGSDMSMFEVEEASRIVTEACDPNANIKFGTSINEEYTGEMKITVIATGFSGDLNHGNVWNRSFTNVASPFTNRPNTQTSQPRGNSFESHGVKKTPNTPWYFANTPTNISPWSTNSSQSDLDVPAYLRNKL